MQSFLLQALSCLLYWKYENSRWKYKKKPEIFALKSNSSGLHAPIFSRYASLSIRSPLKCLKQALTFRRADTAQKMIYIMQKEKKLFIMFLLWLTLQHELTTQIFSPELWRSGPVLPAWEGALVPAALQGTAAMCPLAAGPAQRIQNIGSEEWERPQ